VIVAADARLRLPFTALGTAPEAASSWLLPLVMGAQRAADLVLTSRWFSGTEAVRLGMAARSCDAAALPSEARALAQEIAALPREAVANAKVLLRQGWAQAARGAMDRELAAAHELRALLGPLGAPPPSAP
jgi:enoyl-CoA hydratase/carnithine racemase